MSRPGSSVHRAVLRVSLGEDGAVRERMDLLAAEEPLEIRIATADTEPGGAGEPLTVTMRTPGADFELAAGFLFAEGLISSADAVQSIRYCTAGEQHYNVVTVRLAPGVSLDAARMRRAFAQTSACGVCGRQSIDDVMSAACPRVESTLRLDPAVLLSLPGRLRAAQRVFERTGGLHAAGLFSADGQLLAVREDVGRHNALDKLVGASFLGGELPWSERIVVLSGRIGFELVQKAARAGVAVLAGVSAPSSLAAELAEAAGITLCGFVRGESFNLYSGGERIAAGVPG